MKKLFIWILVASLVCTMFIVNSSAVVYGDINCDGEIRVSDAVLLAQHLALWGVDISDEGMEAADVRHDGVVNTKDAVLLAQYLALWGVTLGPSSTPEPGTSAPETDAPTPGGNPDTGDNEVPADELLF